MKTSKIVSRCLKKRIFNSIEPLRILPLDTREESFAQKPFFAREPKKRFRRKIQILYSFIWNCKGSVFYHEIFFEFRSKKKDFSAKGSVEWKIRFLNILTYFGTLLSLRNLFCELRKKGIFSECNTNYLSHDIQNELIRMMTNEIREENSSIIRQASFV